MKKYIFAPFIVIFLVVQTISCKKGNDDPAFSFRTRKARLVGKWITTNSSTTNIENLYNQASLWTSVNNRTESYNGSSNLVTINTYLDSNGIQKNSQTHTLNEKYAESFEFKKDGSYTYTKEYPDSLIIMESGTWNFLPKSKTKNFKNKEAVELMIANSNTTNLSFGMQQPTTIGEWNTKFKILVLDELKFKEIKVIYDYSDKSVDTEDEIEIKYTLKRE